MALLLIAAGALAVGGAAIGPTMAAYTDHAELGIAAHTQFDAVFIDADDTVTGFGPEGIEAELTAAESYVPGATAVATLRIGNNSSQVPMTLAATLSGAGNLSPVIRVSAELSRGDGSTETLLGNPEAPEAGVPLADAAIPSFTLDARGAEPLPNGALWSGPQSSAATLRIFLHVLDVPELQARDSGEMTATIALTASSGDESSDPNRSGGETST
ncbi:hypothetical protein PQI23_09820 [Leucobacter sp. USCH14]|uniref:hypothetical protein n=1 Tax=Leucobacter sp. USCH14 TaxID=3024838 RepID=UPI0030B54C4E